MNKLLSKVALITNSRGQQYPIAASSLPNPKRNSGMLLQSQFSQCYKCQKNSFNSQTIAFILTFQAYCGRVLANASKNAKLSSTKTVKKVQLSAPTTYINENEYEVRERGRRGRICWWACSLQAAISVCKKRKHHHSHCVTKQCYRWNRADLHCGGIHHFFISVSSMVIVRLKNTPIK